MKEEVMRRKVGSGWDGNGWRKGGREEVALG